MDDRNDATEEDIIGPGTGGTPTAAGTGAPIDRDSAAEEPGVEALIENLRADDEPGLAGRQPYDESAENVGTGTDR